MMPLTLWQNFCVIVGSSTGAFTKLQFLVMTLVPNVLRSPALAKASRVWPNPAIIYLAKKSLSVCRASCSVTCNAQIELVVGGAAFDALVHAAVVTVRVPRCVA